MDRVKPMYEKTLNIKFPHHLGEVFRAILIRHDIVHRNGKTKDGKELVITQEKVKSLIEIVKQLVQQIDNQLIKHDLTNGCT